MENRLIIKLCVCVSIWVLTLREGGDNKLSIIHVSTMMYHYDKVAE